MSFIFPQFSPNNYVSLNVDAKENHKNRRYQRDEKKDFVKFNFDCLNHNKKW